MSNDTQQESIDTAKQVTPASPVIDIQHLKKSFGSQEILKDISLTLAVGENLVVMGKSGSGKSVLIKCLVGLLKPDSGNITILEQDVIALERKELNQLRQKIGFLFQSGALYDSMTVKQNIEFPLRRIKKELTEKQIADKVHEVLENVDLIDSLNKMPSSLSGGMRKRISLARTIVVDPLIMLYDEPTTGLDPVTSDEISALIMDVQKKYKTSSIIITHDIKCALHTANRMVMLREGLVFMEGKPEEFKTSTDEYIQSFSFQ